MPFKSIAQREKMKEFVKQGKITQAQYDEMAKETPDDLAERIHPKREPKEKK